MEVMNNVLEFALSTSPNQDCCLSLNHFYMFQAECLQK